jgi:adenosylhomocysteine nucleosidase
MVLEMNAVITAFGLRPTPDETCWGGSVGNADVTAVLTGIGPALTRQVLNRVLDATFGQPVDHVMVAGICGGLSPDLGVGTLINPEFVVDHASGVAYRHTPPGDAEQAGRLMTTETVTFDPDLSRRFLAEGCLAVDMETAAVAEVCEERGHPWSAYRCIGDRYFDGLLDPRIASLTDEDGTGKMDEIERLVAADPELAVKLDQLARDSTRAAKIASEAAVGGCLALAG